MNKQIALGILWFLAGLAISIGFAFWLSPNYALSKDRTITVSSLEEAYTSRVLALETAIATSTQALKDEYATLAREYTTKNKYPPMEYGNLKTYQLEVAIRELEFELQAITPAYNLLLEALK